MSEDYRSMPVSELDYQSQLANPEWGRSGVSKELRDQLSSIRGQLVNNNGEPILDEAGNPIIDVKKLWELLGYYSRDLRLGNLSNQEVGYCQYHLDLAGDMLQLECKNSFIICLSRVATILELSQSKGGFLRKRQNTVTQESYKQEIEPPKRGMLNRKSQR